MGNFISKSFIPCLGFFLVLLNAFNFSWAQVEEPVSLRLTVSKLTLDMGEKVSIEVLARFKDGNIRDVTRDKQTKYKTSDKSLAVVEKKGFVKALSIGTQKKPNVDIAASYGNLSMIVKINLLETEKAIPKPKPRDQVGLEVSIPKTKIKEGENVQIEVKAIFRNGSMENVTEAIRGTVLKPLFRKVTIDPKGLVKAPSNKGEREILETILVSYRDFGALVQLTIEGKSRDTLKVTSPKTTLRVGETVQLKVTKKRPDGSVLDVTDLTTGTFYRTTSESRLIPEPDGRVTCVGTSGKKRESAIIGVRNGNEHGSLSFELLADGPGPGLEVKADKPEFYEGEQIQLQVLEPLIGGEKRDVTNTSTGTRYLIYPEYARKGKRKLMLDRDGMVFAPSSIGRANWITSIIFVRNGEKVGWVKLKILPLRNRD